MNRARLEHLRSVYRDGLLDDVVPFWLERCPGFVDPEFGGFSVARDRGGQLLDTDKGVWQQGRATWLFATLYRTVEARRDWLEAARSGATFLEQWCFDESDGRMWFHVERNGTPIRKRRYAFSESFAAIAFAEVGRITDDERLRARAVECLQAFVDHVPAPKYTDARPMRAIGQPMITMATAQALRDAIDFDADAIVDRCIDEIERFFVKDDIGCVMECVAPDGGIVDHFDGRTLNPGHALEAAWFILHEAAHRGNDARLIALGTKMVDFMFARGWDDEYGGILYFRDVYDKPVQEYWHDMKFWWPHNEAIIATLYAYALTGEQRFADMHTKVHDWAYAHFPDEKYGEWYGYLHRDGRISVPLKGNLWKGPFHLPRMQLVCGGIVESMLAR